jgi:hypothetical protein
MAAREGKQEGRTVKYVSLPGGKTIEVVYFESSPDSRDASPENVGLHMCPSCSSNLVYPVEWSEASSTHWEVQLRCPNCEWAHTGVFDQETVERFDCELDRGMDDLVEDLQRLEYANMEDEINRFSAALVEDYILPEDF